MLASVKHLVQGEIGRAFGLSFPPERHHLLGELVQLASEQIRRGRALGRQPVAVRVEVALQAGPGRALREEIVPACIHARQIAGLGAAAVVSTVQRCLLRQVVGDLLQAPTLPHPHDDLRGHRTLQDLGDLRDGHARAELVCAGLKQVRQAVDAHVGLEEPGVGDQPGVRQVFGDGTRGLARLDDKLGGAGLGADRLIEPRPVGLQIGAEHRVAGAAGQAEAEDKAKAEAKDEPNGPESGVIRFHVSPDADLLPRVPAPELGRATWRAVLRIKC